MIIDEKNEPPEETTSPVQSRLCQKEYLPRNVARAIFDKIPPSLQVLLTGCRKMRDTPATAKLAEIFGRFGNIFDFFAEQPFYAAFQTETRVLGLAEGFDRWSPTLEFRAPIQPALKFLPRKNLSGEISKEAQKLHLPEIFRRLPPESVEESVLKDAQPDRDILVHAQDADQLFFQALQSYFNSLFLLAKCRYRNFDSKIQKMIQKGDLIGAAAKLHEFYQDKIGNELIALETDARLKTSLLAILDQELDRIDKYLRDLQLEDAGVEKTPEKEAVYGLRIDERTPDAILRGIVSSDCTDIRLDYAFHETVPQHLLDPGFINFKLFDKGEWVGNVYTLVMEEEGRGAVLVIDAIQTSEEHSFEAPITVIAEKIIEQMKSYAEQVGFKGTYLSNFVSNRGLLNYGLPQKYPSAPVEVRKVGGFNHLKELSLWDEQKFRNEYLETFMAGKPNEESQTLPLRKV